MRKKLLVGGLMLCSSSPLFALDKVGASIGVGSTVPIGEYGRDEQTGFNFAGSVDVPTPLSRLHVRLQALFSETDSEFGAEQGTQIVGGNVGFSYVVSQGAAIEAYLTAGAGVDRVGVSWSPASLPCVGCAPASRMTRHETKPSCSIGGGTSIDVGGVQLFVEASYVTVFTDYGSTDFVPVTMGVRFGGR